MKICGGSGNIIKELCGSCSGEGRSQGESTETLDIPAGVSEGNYIPLRGKGNAGRRGGDSGDVLVVIEEKEHPLFIRDNDDVLFEFNDGDRRIQRNFSIKTDSIEVIIDFLLRHGISNNSNYPGRDRYLTKRLNTYDEKQKTIIG